MEMDRKRIIGEVAARHGVRLEEDDPAFILMTIAELTLRDAQQEFLAASALQLQASEKALERMQRLTGRSFGMSPAIDPFHHARDAAYAHEPRLSQLRVSILSFACGFIFAGLAATSRWLLQRLSGC